MKLELRNLKKSFGETEVLHGISLTAVSGEAHGFLGRNGAGKTTTIRCIMDVFKPDSGELLIDGRPMDRHKLRIGYMPEERGMYDKARVLDQLVYFGELKGMSRQAAEASATSYLERLELLDRAKDELQTLSKGNQQKIQIIQALIDDPEILILDEPFSGLDPVNAETLKELIREHVSKNRIVLFSSHQMSNVEEFCDNITLIRQGSVLLTDNLDAVKTRWGAHQMRLRLEGMNQAETLRTLEAHPELNVSLWEDHESVIVRLQEGTDARAFLGELLQKDLTPSAFLPYRPSLETIFITLDQEAAAQEKQAREASSAS